MVRKPCRVSNSRAGVACSGNHGGGTLPVLMIGEVPNLTEEIYGGLLEQMKPVMRAAKGFIAHSGGAESEWRVARRRDVGVRGRRPGIVR